MLTDLFSHKIHSSTETWPDKLVELAFIFEEFDGLEYSRDAIEARLREISPRFTYASLAHGSVRDQSKFRDEISAYPAYLGLYSLVNEDSKWILRLSETARACLIREEPDVSAFLRLQLLLFQFPNGSGATYSHDHVSIKPNAASKTLEYIQNEMHVSPMRLITCALAADAKLREVEILNAKADYSEIYFLANDATVRKHALPNINQVASRLDEFRRSDRRLPFHFERRFHLLKHTEIFEINAGGITFRETEGVEDSTNLKAKIEAILREKVEFRGFDHSRSAAEIGNVVRSGTWGKYFDGVQSLSASTVEILGVSELATREIAIDRRLPIQTAAIQPRSDELPFNYPWRDFQPLTPSANPSSSRTRGQYADPEVTRIKLQRRNLTHKILLGKIDELLATHNARTQETEHIDLFASIPNDGSFLFEVKSGGENLLDQIRKGISQLYEYRYRYASAVPNDVHLCLVLGEQPIRVPWVKDYLINDRGIALCWVNQDGVFEYPAACAHALDPLFGRG